MDKLVCTAKGRGHVRGMRAVLSALATASMVLATSGAALASTPAYETRADFVYRLDMQLGIKPVYPATPTFKDVPASSAYYGYIEAAAQQGITNGFSNGTFGPGLALTRAEAAKYEVIAYGQGDAAKAIASTSFADNALIPTALVGYVAVASKLGLLKGFPNGTFQPQAELTTAQETHLLSQLATAMGSGAGSAGGYDVKVNATSTDVSPGQFVTLSALVTDASGAAVNVPVTFSVTGSNAGTALLSGASFVASQPGTYTVQATAGTATGTLTIDVYGSAVGLKISAPSSIVANGNASSSVSVSFVDAGGNVVANDTGTITLTSGNSAAVGIMNGTAASGSASLAAVNGVAEFTVVGGSLPGSTATLTATAGGLTASTSVTTASQTANSLSVTVASPYLAVNAPGTTQNVTVKVLDQSGQPMIYGTYAFTVTISGPATFAGGGTSPESFVYSGLGTNSSGTQVTIQDVQGSTGTITVTASGTGLTSGSASLTAVVAGSPSAIQVTAPATTTLSADSGGVGLKFGIAVVDSHGYPVTGASSLMVTVKNSSGQIATNMYVSGLPQSTTAGVTVSAGQFTVTDNGAGTDAGTYTLQATDPSGTLAPSAAITFSVTAGAAKLIKLTAPAFVSAAAPQATYVAQVTDAYGNAVALSGIPITFTSTVSNINPSTQTVATNAAGQAQVTFTVPGYVGSSYPITASATLNGQNYTTNPVPFTVENTTARAVSIALVDNTSGNYYGNPAVAQSGDQVKITIKATDQYGNLVATADKVLINSTGTGTLTNWNTSPLGGGGLGNITANADGTYTITLYGGQAVVAASAGSTGTVVLQATDESVQPNAMGSSSIGVQPGPVMSFNIFDTAGNLATSESVAANTPSTFTLKAVDVAHNPAIPTANYLVAPQTSQLGGQFRVGSPSGANLGVGQGVLVAPGSGGVALYYVTSTAASSVDLTAPYWVSYAAGIGMNGNGALVTSGGGSIQFSPSTGGSVVDLTNGSNVNSSGLFTAPSGSGTDTLALQVGGVSEITFQVAW